MLTATRYSTDLCSMERNQILAALPVVDEEGRILGVVTYDDLVEALVPDECRWRSVANQEHRYEPSGGGRWSCGAALKGHSLR